MSMLQQRSAIAFRWILPLIQFAICVVALWPSRGMVILRVKTLFHPFQKQEQPRSNLQGDQKIILSPDWETQVADLERAEHRQWIPVALNLPCGLFQLPYVIASPAKQEWTPRNMDVKTWRVIAWPVVGCLFWWIAGRSIDALLAARRRVLVPHITWIETFAGAVLCPFCAVAAVGLPLFSEHHDEDFPMRILVAGLVIWAALGGTIVYTGLSQWRMRRMAKS